MFENLTTQFDNLESEKNYWFLRTSGGRNFNTFTANSFVGINWNYVTAADLRDKSEAEIKTIIANNERNQHGQLYDVASKEGRAKITSVYTKLQRFKNLKAGDMIVIPSSGSRFLSFGVVTDEEIYNNFEDNSCDFHKRRNVHWIITEKLEKLDAIWYKIIFSMHAISNLNTYAGYIDKVVSSVFVKGEKSHLVLQVKKQGDINYDSLNGVLQNVRNLTELINISFNLGEDLSGNSVKLNVQSPGTIEFVYSAGRSLLLASIFLGVPIVTSCSHGEAGANASAQEIQAEKDANIILINNKIDGEDRLNQAEKQGLKNFAAVNYDTIAQTKQNMHEIDSLVNN